MVSSLPLIPQRLSSGVRRRLELAEASAREALVEVHAMQALELVSILAPRMPFDEAVDRYIEIMDLDGDEAEMVHTRALALLSDPELGLDLARERHRGGKFDWRYLTPPGAIRFIQRKRRRSAEEELWTELAAARAEEALVRAHIEHALQWVELLEEDTDPTQAIRDYLHRLEVPEGRSHSVYQRLLAHLAETLLPRLIEVEEEDEEEQTSA